MISEICGCIRRNFKTETGIPGNVKEMLHPDIELDVPDYPPVYGACIMCCLLCGVDTKPVKERFMMSY